MKFLIINTDYPEFLKWHYSQDRRLPLASYDEQMRARNASLFTEADFYSKNIVRSGHEAFDIYANNEPMQKAWAREHGLKAGSNGIVKGAWGKARHYCARLAGRIPVQPVASALMKAAGSAGGQPDWFYEVLAAQIAYHKPDVLYVHALRDIDIGFLKRMKPYYKILVGQHAATTLPQDMDLSAYDLFISSFPPTVEYFKKRGFKAEYVKLGFEPGVLASLAKRDRRYDLTFIGSLYPVHSTRIELLEYLCGQFPQMKVWGPGVDNLRKDSPIRKCYVGQAWGKEMYQILCDSKITLNHHGNVPPYANNMRLFEATGVGTLLVTDWKENLEAIFRQDREVLAYKDPEECARLIRFSLDHEDEREKIARAGQQRTLDEHSYFNRMQELVGIVGKYL